MPLEKALALILGMNGYTYSMTIYKIATDELLTEQENITTTEIFTLNFTNLV